MKRSEFLHFGLYAAAIPVFSGFGIQTKSSGSFTLLRKSVGLYENRGGTMGWYANGEVSLVIDSQFPEQAEAFVADFNRDKDANVDFLINTHHHGDHTGGNQVFKDQVKMMIAHQNVPDLMKAAARQRDRTQDPDGIPKVGFEKEFSLDLGKEIVRCYHFGPAHTSGDIMIHFEQANVVHMGDLVFNRMPAFVDRSAGATVRGWVEVLERAMNLFDSDTLYIFGHGNDGFGVKGSAADLKYKQDFLNTSYDYVAQGIKAGKTQDEITAIDRVPGFENNYRESWKGAVPRMLTAIYEEVLER